MSPSPRPPALSPFHVTARGKLPNELRRPLTPMGLVRGTLEEGADADALVDTDMDEDDLSVRLGADGHVEFTGA